MIKRPEIVAEEHLVFLDELREPGSVNMYAATPHLIDAFGLERDDAKVVLKYWMDSYVERHDVE